MKHGGTPIKQEGARCRMVSPSPSRGEGRGGGEGLTQGRKDARISSEQDTGKEP